MIRRLAALALVCVDMWCYPEDARYLSRVRHFATIVIASLAHVKVM